MSIAHPLVLRSSANTVNLGSPVAEVTRLQGICEVLATELLRVRLRGAASWNGIGASAMNGGRFTCFPRVSAGKQAAAP
jgi:hypothetical protein